MSATRTTRTTSVAYAGERGASAPLTWGQRAIGIALAAVAEAGRPASFNIGRVVEIPAGRRHDEVLAALARLLERHEVLRSTFREPDGTLRQTVHRVGTLDVALAEADPGTARSRAEDLTHELTSEPFLPDRLHPIRFGIVVVHGAPAHLALALSHQAVDAVGLKLVLDDLAALMTGEPPPAPGRGGQPLDVGEAERAGLAPLGRAALASWREALDSAPRAMFDHPRRPVSGERFARLDIRSPAIAWAATKLARRCRVTTSTVLVAAHALVLSAYTGHITVAMSLVASNRQHAHLRPLVGVTSQGGLSVLDVAGITFEQAVRRMLSSSLRTYARTSYDPDGLAALLVELRHDQGRFHDLQVIHNDVRGTDQDWPDAPTGDLTAAEVAELRSRTTVGEGSLYMHHELKWYEEVIAAPDAFEACVHLDRAYVPVAGGERLLRGLEALLVQAVSTEVACDDVATVAGIDPVPRPATWVRVGQDLVNTVAVRELIAAAAATRQVAVGHDAASGLTAYLGPEASVTLPAALHQAICARITADTPDLAAPARYVFCKAAPADPDDITAWRATAVRQEGSGRD